MIYFIHSFVQGFMMAASLFLIRPSRRPMEYTQREWAIADTGSLLGVASGCMLLIYLAARFATS
jgi:hypothetical protein